MIYNFVDTTQLSGEIPNADLPSEALQLNGEFLEDLIDGYRTLTVSGREALARSIKSFKTGVRDGETLQSSRYPTRTITVKYQLLCKTNEAYREAYNTLGSLLSLEESELVFNDEMDKFFIGTCTEISIPEAGKNNVTGEITFTCLDPFKYSVEEFEALPQKVGAVDWQDNFMEETDIDGKTIPLVEPSGNYAKYEKGQKLTKPVVEGTLTVTGDDADEFKYGEDYVLDATTNTVYVLTHMLNDDVTLDGWKYKTTDDILADNMAMFAIDYKGTIPSSPELSAEFKTGQSDEMDEHFSGKDDCGYIAFIDEDKSIIQIGDIDEDDKENKVKGSVTRYTNFATTKPIKNWETSKDYKLGVDDISSSGPLNTIDGGLGYTKYSLANKKGWVRKVTKKTVKVKGKKVTRTKVKFINPSSVAVARPATYGKKTSKYYGFSIKQKIPDDKAGNHGAKNFTASWEQILASTDAKQKGIFAVALVNNTGGSRKLVAGIKIKKGSNGSKGYIYHYVNGKNIAGVDTKIDISKYNKYFGLSKKLYKKVEVRDKKGENKAWRKKHRNKKKMVKKDVYTGCTHPVRSSYIQKKGQTVTFNIGGIKHTYRDEAITDTFVNEVYITFSAKGKPLGYNGIQWFKFFNATLEIEVDIKNTFTIGDEVVADCKDGTITLNGNEKPRLGAYGNDWETFTLEKGMNNILCTWSEWSEGKPTPKVKYREVYL